MFYVGRPVDFCISGWSSCAEVNGKIMSTFSYQVLWERIPTCRCGMRSSWVIIPLTLKGLQTLLPEVWECPAPLGVQRSPLVTLFNVGSAKVGGGFGKIPHVPVVCLPDALYPEGSAKLLYSVTSSRKTVLFAFHMCVWRLCRGLSAADDQTHWVYWEGTGVHPVALTLGHTPC